MTDVSQAAPKRSHARRNFFIVLVLLIVVALLLWHFAKSSSGGQKQQRRVTATVGIGKPEVSDVPVTLAAIGTVQPIVTATVRTQLAGTLFSLAFQEGQMVTKGQLLAQIDPRPFRLALTEAEGNQKKDEAQLAAARVDLQRYQTLLQEDSVPRQQVDTQAALVKQLEGTIDADKAAVGTAKLNLDYTAIKAPVSGKVGLRQADVGNYVTPGDTNGIVVITQTSPIDVAFAIPQSNLPGVQAQVTKENGLQVTALDQDSATKLADGKFSTFDNQVDSTTGTVRAKARFDNKDNKLFPNQFVNVSLLVDTLHNAVTVPVTAIRHGTQGDFVFLMTAEKTAKLQVVKLGPADGPRQVVLSGVQTSDTVITEGADRLDDGGKVTLPGDKPSGPGGPGQADQAQGQHGKRGGKGGKGGHGKRGNQDQSQGQGQ